MGKLSKIFGSEKEQEEAISIINDPFKKSCITYINMSMWIGDFTGKTIIDGYVKFKNGGTEGKQEFSATSLPELMMKIYKFCEELSD